MNEEIRQLHSGCGCQGYPNQPVCPSETENNNWLWILILLFLFCNGCLTDSCLGQSTSGGSLTSGGGLIALIVLLLLAGGGDQFLNGLFG